MKQFNNHNITIGANVDRFGAEMFIDELKLFNTFLARQRIVENMGGDNVPFGFGSLKLACLDCSLKEVASCDCPGLQFLPRRLPFGERPRTDRGRVPARPFERLEQDER